MEARQVLMLPNKGGIMIKSKEEKPWVDDEDDTAVDSKYERLWYKQALLDEHAWLTKQMGYEVNK